MTKQPKSTVTYSIKPLTRDDLLYIEGGVAARTVPVFRPGKTLKERVAS